MKDPDKLDINFIDNPDGSIPCLKVSLNVMISDEMIMFHVCHIYHNILLIVKHENRDLQELIDEINLDIILRSVCVAVNMRLKECNSNYIDEHFKEIKNNQQHFDKCLEIFSRCRKELTNYRETYLNNLIVLENKN